MLNAEQVEALRAKYPALAEREVGGRWCDCVDGPLGGLLIRVPEYVCRHPGAAWAVCFLTPRGPVVAIYVQAPEPNRWVFRGYECPGARESGQAVA